MDLAELDSLRVWLERRYPNLMVKHSKRPLGYSCRERSDPGLTISWCEGLTSLRLCWRYPSSPWCCAELSWEEVRRMLGEYRAWLRGWLPGGEVYKAPPLPRELGGEKLINPSSDITIGGKNADPEPRSGPHNRV